MGRAFVGLVINRSWVQILQIGQKVRNNLGQVVHTCVSLSPMYYRPRGSNALPLGR